MTPALSKQLSNALRAIADIIDADDSSPQGFVTPSEFATAFQCSSSTASRRMKELGAAKFNGILRLSRASFNEYMKTAGKI